MKRTKGHEVMKRYKLYITGKVDVMVHLKKILEVQTVCKINIHICVLFFNM